FFRCNDRNAAVLRTERRCEREGNENAANEGANRANGDGTTGSECDSVPEIDPDPDLDPDLDLDLDLDLDPDPDPDPDPRPASCLSRRCREQTPHPQQVVRRTDHVRCDLVGAEASEARLTEVADSLHPAEHLLDALAEALADRVARQARRSRVDRRATTPMDALSDLRRHLAFAAPRDEVARVVALVGSHR